MYRVRARSPSRADQRIYAAARHGRYLMAVVVLSRFPWIECALECHFYQSGPLYILPGACLDKRARQFRC